VNDSANSIIFDRLKFSSRTQKNVEIDRCPTVDIYHHQIVLAITLTSPEVEALPGDAPRFPAVLDTGFNDNLLITERQLQDWANPDAELEHKAQIDDGISLHEAKIWFHRNVALSRTEYLDDDPFPLELRRGIFVARNDRGTRLPILGLRALADNQLSLVIDTLEEHLTIKHKELILKME